MGSPFQIVIKQGDKTGSSDPVPVGAGRFQPSAVLADNHGKETVNITFAIDGHKTKSKNLNPETPTVLKFLDDFEVSDGYVVNARISNPAGSDLTIGDQVKYRDEPLGVEDNVRIVEALALKRKEFYAVEDSSGVSLPDRIVRRFSPCLPSVPADVTKLLAAPIRQAICKEEISPRLSFYKQIGNHKVYVLRFYDEDDNPVCGEVFNVPVCTKSGSQYSKGLVILGGQFAIGNLFDTFDDVDPAADKVAYLSVSAVIELEDLTPDADGTHVFRVELN